MSSTSSLVIENDKLRKNIMNCGDMELLQPITWETGLDGLIVLAHNKCNVFGSLYNIARNAFHFKLLC